MKKTHFYVLFVLASMLINCKTGNKATRLSVNGLAAIEKNLDHAGFIRDFDNKALARGERIYNANCINCHGDEENEGSIPMSLKFWSEPFKAGNDAYAMYRTITQGYGAMPPQVNLSPQEKYDVIHYIQTDGT